MQRYEGVVVLEVAAENPKQAAERIVQLLRAAADAAEPEWFDGDEPGDYACLMDAASERDEEPSAGEVSLWVNEQSLDGVFKMMLEAEEEFFQHEEIA